MKNGYCVLPGTCASYPQLWNYTFKVDFYQVPGYMRIPLATFAADGFNGTRVCNIFVEYLQVINDNKTESGPLTQDYSIVLGTMFFQSFDMYVYQKPISYSVPTRISFSVNPNALSRAYIGRAVNPKGPDAFVHLEKHLVLLHNTDGPNPIIYASFNNDTATYGRYYVDFDIDFTIVWDQNCVYVPTNTSCND